MKKKQQDDIMGEGQTDLPINEGMLDDASFSEDMLTSSVVPGGCPNEDCTSKQAYFYQLQTRSADEPPTSFYKCIECSKQWREY